MVKKIRRKIKKIAMKASLVSMELEDITEENKEQKRQLSEDFSDEFEFISWKQQQNEVDQAKEIKQESKQEEDLKIEITKKEIPIEMKKLYRKIALKTHPDKLEDDTLNEIFTQAAVATEEENWMLLIELAGELKLDLDFLSDETCELVEKSIQENEAQIKTIRNSFSFMWANQKTEKDKELFTLLFYKQFKINADEFNAWLKENKDKKSL